MKESHRKRRRTILTQSHLPRKWTLRRRHLCYREVASLERSSTASISLGPGSRMAAPNSRMNSSAVAARAAWTPKPSASLTQSGGGWCRCYRFDSAINCATFDSGPTGSEKKDRLLADNHAVRGVPLLSALHQDVGHRLSFPVDVALRVVNIAEHGIRGAQPARSWTIPSSCLFGPSRALD